MASAKPTAKRSATLNSVLLHPNDNVVVANANIQKGETVRADGEEFTAQDSVEVGHKLARRLISAGDAVIKYGAQIGSATADCKPGDLVHMHNMKSDYIASHTREAVD